MPENGLIHVYYGDGKGKTTAALGLALRAAGYGKSVVVVQLLKGWKCGEHNSLLQLPNVTLFQGKPVCNKFVKDMSDDEKRQTRAAQDECLKNALELVESGRCDVLVLDEAIEAYHLKMVDSDIVENLVYNKPESLELIITGHKPDAKLLNQADYITEMVKHKHPYDKATAPRLGIEF